MTPRDLLLAGLDRYPQHELYCGYHNQWVEDPEANCTCGLAQWRAQVKALIDAFAVVAEQRPLPEDAMKLLHDNLMRLYESGDSR